MGRRKGGSSVGGIIRSAIHDVNRLIPAVVQFHPFIEMLRVTVAVPVDIMWFGEYSVEGEDVGEGDVAGEHGAVAANDHSGRRSLYAVPDRAEELRKAQRPDTQTFDELTWVEPDVIGPEYKTDPP